MPFGRKMERSDDGTEFRVEIALGLESSAGSGVWGPDPDEGLWDEALWNGEELYWVDVTSRALFASCSSGRDKWEQRFRTGTGIFRLENDDGIFSPDGGRIGDLRFRPGRWIRLLGRVNTEPWIPLWTGYIDSISDAYAKGASGITAQITAYDTMGNLVIDNPPALESPIPAELTSTRVERLLNLFDWPASWRDIDTGVFEVQSSLIALNRLEEIQIAADSEGGAFYVKKNGYLRFRNRDYLEQGRSATVQFDIGAISGDGVQIIGATTDWSTQRVYNDVSMARRNGTAQRVTDDASISMYGRRTYRRFNLENESDADVLWLANRFLEAFRFDHERIDQLTVTAMDEQGARNLLNMELADRVRVNVKTLIGWSFTMEAWINRFTYIVTADDFTVALRVDNTDRTDPFDRSGFDDGFNEGFGV